VRARLSGYQDDVEEEEEEQESGVLLPREAAAAAAAAAGAGPGRPAQQRQQQQQEEAGSRGVRASPGSRAVLLALLAGAGCREERAVLLPEAFTPPGMEVRGSLGRGGMWGRKRKRWLE
jgi:hypothetical protein